MRELVKRAVAGTRWEEPLKRALSSLTGHRNAGYDWRTIAIMRRALGPRATGIDIGALDGAMLRHMRRLAPQGMHLAFEPQPEKAAALAARFPEVRVFPYALGAAPGVATFHVALRHPALSGLRRRAKDLGDEPTREVEVRVETLDRTVPPDLPVAFVKVDVEGGERDVFRGGIETLRRSRPVVVFECGLGSADHFGVEPEEVFDALVEAGLAVSLLDAFLARRPALSRGAFGDQYRSRRNFYFVAHP
jgi:FkbM family methyltransferase